jgi:tRNA uridine 5-carbamoylmethylation protein Kti12
MSTVFVMVGLPGTGKSTLVDKLIRSMGDHGDQVFVYSTDTLIEDWAKSQGWTYDFAFSKYVDRATREMNSMLDNAIKQKRDIIWDQTNLGAKKRQRILNRFSNPVWTKECHCILSPIGDSQNSDWEWRLANRPGKTIPGHIIRSMRETFFVPTLDEGYDRVYYYDMYGNEVGDNYALQISRDSHY